MEKTPEGGPGHEQEKAVVPKGLLNIIDRALGKAARAERTDPDNPENVAAVQTAVHRAIQEARDAAENSKLTDVD